MTGWHVRKSSCCSWLWRTHTAALCRQRAAAAEAGKQGGATVLLLDDKRGRAAAQKAPLVTCHVCLSLKVIFSGAWCLWQLTCVCIMHLPIAVYLTTNVPRCSIRMMSVAGAVTVVAVWTRSPSLTGLSAWHTQTRGAWRPPAAPLQTMCTATSVRSGQPSTHAARAWSG